MRILLNLFALCFSVLLIYLSIQLFLDINRLQYSLNRTNDLLNFDTPGLDKKIILSQFSEEKFKFLKWDSEINHILATSKVHLAASLVNKGQKNEALTKAQNLFETTQYLTPRNISSLIGNLSVLIDQGAPLDFLLPKIDHLITLVPKDQDLKADISMLCFKLAIINQDAESRTRLIARLDNLFDNSMDYRGMTQVHRYANLFGQNELLMQVKTNVQN